MDTAIYAAARKYGVALTDADMATVRKMAALGKAKIAEFAAKTKARTDAPAERIALALSLGRVAWEVAS